MQDLDSLHHFAWTPWVQRGAAQQKVEARASKSWEESLPWQWGHGSRKSGLVPHIESHTHYGHPYVHW